MKKIVIFASGSGSNFQAIVEQLHQKHCDVALLICDKPGAICIERATKLGIAAFVTNPNEYRSKVAYELALIGQLALIQPDLIVLAGYMRLIGPTILSQYEGKIINIHPSLLPAFPGRHGIQDAVDYGVKIIGVTVHYVDAGIDTGNIIDQDCFRLKPNQSLEQIEDQVHTLEHQLYPQVIKNLLEIT